MLYEAMEKAALVSYLDRLTTWELWCLVLVAGGVLGETFEFLFHKLQSERARKLLIRSFASVLAVGVVGEATVGYLRRAPATELLAIQDNESLTLKNEIAAATKDAALAHKEAADANERAGTANERAGQLMVLAERERTAREKLEKQLADRTLTIPQQIEIAAKMKPFAYQAINIVATSEREPKTLADQIANALVAAQWRVEEIPLLAATNPPVGLTVYVVPKADPSSVFAAKLLAAALAADLSVAGPKEEVPTRNNLLSLGNVPAEVSIVVGSK
jgi:hypothetical protein